MEFQYKVLAVVKVNNIEALVLDKYPELKYQLSNGCITGTDGLFADCLYYEKPSPRFQAFAGRKFEIKLHDGNVITCEGQYWDGVKDEHAKVLGFAPARVTINSYDALKKCYVFCGTYANIEKFQQLRATYNGKVWEYWEYDKHLKDEANKVIEL
jgi:hypothetical protein